MFNVKNTPRLLTALLLAATISSVASHSTALAQDGKAAPTTTPAKSAASTTKNADSQAEAAANPLPWPRYGIDFARYSSPWQFNAAREVGAQAVRVTVVWSELEEANTTPNNYYWAPLDYKLDALAAAGLAAQFVISACPAWACRDEHGPIDLMPVAEFTELVTALAERYSVAPYNAHYWEFWDEPDSTKGTDGMLGWGRHGADYAALLAAAVPAIRAVDSRATIANGGLAYDWFIEDHPSGPFYRNFLNEFLQAGGGAYIDYLAFHWEPANVHWLNLAAKTAEIRALASQYNFTKPLVSGETALTSDTNPAWGTPQWGPNSDAIQARYLTQVFAQALANGLPGMIWFTISDDVPGGIYEAFTSSGLTDYDGDHKPSFYAYQTVVRELGDSAYLRSAAAGELGDSSVEAYLFAGRENPVWVMWANSATATTVSLPAAGVSRVVDMLGVEQTPEISDGNLTFALGYDPLYVELRALPRFSDVPHDYYAYESIEYLAAHGIISGYASGTFAPAQQTTRGQLAKIITLASGWSVVSSAESHLSDLSRDNPFYGYINTAYNRGVISGYADGTFRWNESVTRGQLAKIIVRARGWAVDTTGGPHFSDVSTSNPFYDYIETAYNHHILSGYQSENGLTFRWGNTATRAQISKIVYLAITQ